MLNGNVDRFALLTSHFALWYSPSEWLARAGFDSYAQSNVSDARRQLALAALRSPGMVLDARFQKVFGRK